MSKSSNNITTYLGVFYAAILVASILFGLAVISYQILLWLKYGYWKPMPNRVAFEFLKYNLSYIDNPKKWLGLAKIGQFFLSLPLSITVPVVSILTLNLLQKRIDEELKYFKKQ